MQVLQVHVPDEDRPAVETAADEAGIDPFFTDETGDRGGSLAYVPVPTGAVDPVLEQLYDAGLDRDTYAVAADVDAVSVPILDALADRYVEGPRGPAGISHPEIRERAADLKPGRASYVAFSLLSAVVAVGGLLLDSAIAIVGAMVIAPFAGSTLSASVGAVIDDRDMVVDSATSQLLGLALAVVGGVVMSLLLRQTGFVPARLAIAQGEQVGAFLTPNVLTLTIAIAAGAAGALALATDLPVSIAGVAVAAAIVPSAATAGIGVVWGDPVVVIGALVLLLMNIVFINLAAYLALVGLGYRSSVIRSARENLSVSVRAGAYAVVVLVFAVVLVVTVAATAQHLAFEQAVKNEVDEVLAGDEYRQLELVSTSTEYNEYDLLGQTETVTVTVARPSGTDHAELAGTLRDRITREPGDAVAVNVRFVQFQSASAADGAPAELPRFGEVVRRMELGEAVADVLRWFSQALGLARAGCPVGAAC